MTESEKHELNVKEFNLWCSEHCPRLLDGLLHWITSSLLLITPVQLEGVEQGAEPHRAGVGVEYFRCILESFTLSLSHTHSLTLSLPLSPLSLSHTLSLTHSLSLSLYLPLSSLSLSLSSLPPLSLSLRILSVHTTIVFPLLTSQQPLKTRHRMWRCRYSYGHCLCAYLSSTLATQSTRERV